MLTKIKEKLGIFEQQAMIVGYVLYFFNAEKGESKLFELTEIKSTLEISRYGEVYDISKPAFFIDGKPVFLIVKGIPLSLEFKNFDEKCKEFEIKGYSASEINARIYSIYVNTVFRKGNLQFKDYLVILLSNVITGLLVYIVSTLTNVANTAVAVGG